MSENNVELLKKAIEQNGIKNNRLHVIVVGIAPICNSYTEKEAMFRFLSIEARRTQETFVLIDSISNEDKTEFEKVGIKISDISEILPKVVPPEPSSISETVKMLVNEQKRSLDVLAFNHTPSVQTYGKSSIMNKVFYKNRNFKNPKSNGRYKPKK